MNFLARLCRQTLVCVAALSLALPALAQDTVMFNYQGRVKVKGTDFDGPGHFKFAILSPDGSSTLWSNDSTSADGSEPTTGLDIPVTDGVFNVLMGASGQMDSINSTIFQNKSPLKLRTWFSDGVNGFQALHPDHNLVNVNLITSQTGGSDFTIYVNGQTGDDSNSGLKPNQAKKTIQAAVDIVPARVMANVTIEIADGVYPEEVLIYGISSKPGKKLSLVGDTNWNPSESGEPAVIITGADGQTKGVRRAAVHAVQSSLVEFVGLSCRDARELGMDLRKGEYTIRNCLASENGINGINIGVQSSADVFDSAGSHNGIHGIGVNKNSLATITNCKALDNGHSGLSVIQSSTATLDGSGEFSRNKVNGIMNIVHSNVGCSNTSTYLIQNNDAYGISAGWASYFANMANHTTITGNKVGQTQAFNGGVLNW